MPPTSPTCPRPRGTRSTTTSATFSGWPTRSASSGSALVSHDVGAYVAQAFARAHPNRLIGLFFFDCPYAGIGRRWAEPDHLKEIWYQTFNQQPWAAELVGSSRQACEVYFRHFLRHWARRCRGVLRR